MTAEEEVIYLREQVRRLTEYVEELNTKYLANLERLSGSISELMKKEAGGDDEAQK